MNPSELYPTDRLPELLAEREITWEEVVDTVANPESVVGPDHRDRRIYQKGTLSVVVTKEGDVMTALRIPVDAEHHNV